MPIGTQHAPRGRALLGCSLYAGGTKGAREN